MQEVQELIDLIQKISDKLDYASEQEQKFCNDLCHEFSKYSLQMNRMKDNIQEISYILGA
jgi:hypothetical protein